jgi:heptosyltransferase II
LIFWGHLKEFAKEVYLGARQKLLYRLQPFLARKSNLFQNPIAIKKILFIRPDRIGDMVLSTPAIRALKDLYPKAHLTVLASPTNQVLLRHAPHVDELLIGNLGGLRRFRDLLNLMNWIKKSRVDLVVDPMPGVGIQSALLSFCTGASVRIGFAGAGREIFYNRVLPQPSRERHFLELTLDSVRGLGASVATTAPSIVLTREETEFAREWIKSNNPLRQKLVGIHPGGYYPTQRWPIENYIQLSRKLLRAHPCRIVVFGGVADRTMKQDLTAAVGIPAVIFGDPDLRKAAAVMSHLDVMVCNNSGPLHLAAAMNVPTVSFIGPTNASRWWPVGNHHRVLRVDELECLGCGKGTCPKGSLECLQRISPDMALEAVESILANRAR